MSQQIEHMLGARGIDFDFEPNVRIDEIREAEGIQVRTIQHRAPKDQVTKYTVAMKNGANFPAIVLNDNLERIDGNTRLEATIKLGRDTIPAYVCHGLTPLMARSLSVELNQSNGLAMTNDEIRAFVAGAVNEGESPEVKMLARMTGVRESTISRWIAVTQFSARADSEGIDEGLLVHLPESTRSALQAVRLARVFKELTVLAAESRMPAAEAKKLVGRVNGASSESEALEMVAAERRERAEEVRAAASGFKPRARASKGSAQHLGGLLRFEVDDLLDVDPEKHYETFVKVKAIRDTLNTVVERAEREWDLTPPEPAPGDAGQQASDEASAAPALVE